MFAKFQQQSRRRFGKLFRAHGGATQRQPAEPPWRAAGPSRRPNHAAASGAHGRPGAPEPGEPLGEGNRFFCCRPATPRRVRSAEPAAERTRAGGRRPAEDGQPGWRPLCPALPVCPAGQPPPPPGRSTSGWATGPCGVQNAVRAVSQSLPSAPRRATGRRPGSYPGRRRPAPRWCGAGSGGSCWRVGGLGRSSAGQVGEGGRLRPGLRFRDGLRGLLNLGGRCRVGISWGSGRWGLEPGEPAGCWLVSLGRGID